MAIPTDPLFGQQLWLRNTNAGQFDLNVIDVWDDYTGEGVQVTVIDSGYDLNHNDIDGNLLTNIDWDYTNGDNNPDANGGNHGQAVIGIIAAEEGNNYGGVGVAWDSKVVAYQRTGSGYLDAAGLGDGNGNTFGDDNGSDVINGSFGWATNFFAPSWDNNIDNLPELMDHGRGGLGTSFVKSNGNSRVTNPATSTGDPMQGTTVVENSSGYNISVGALRLDGWVTNYSSPGANLLVSAFGDDLNNNAGVLTTANTGGGNISNDFRNFSGTSAAAPEVTGVIALMLEANPDLGWRDIQTILSYSARHVGSEVGTAANTGAPAGGGFEIDNSRTGNSTWGWNEATNWNGGALHFSNDYGFGLVDAKAAVRLAETWVVQSTSENMIEQTVEFSTGTFDPASGVFDGRLNKPTVEMIVEYVTVNIDFSVDDINDMEIYLRGPGGTEVELLNDVGGATAPGTDSYTTGTDGWDFGTNAFRGTFVDSTTENWTVWLRNDDGSGASGDWTVTDIDVTFRGRAATPDEFYIFTEEYSDYDGVAGHVTNFNGGAAGASQGRINASAVSSDTTLDFVNNTGSIDGVAVTVTNIQHAYTGDGDDTVIGDGLTTKIFTGRGDDVITGGSLGETLNGGRGQDTVAGGDGNDVIIDGAFQTSEGQDSILGQGGNDLIIAPWITTGNSYDGGLGNDTIDISGDGSNFNSGSGRAVDLTGTFNAFGSSFTGFENATTGSGFDELIGSNSSNKLVAGRGNDTVDGGSGNDTIYGDDIPFVLLDMNQGSVRDQFLISSGYSDMPKNNLTVEWLFQGTSPGSNSTSFISYGVSGSTNEFLVFGNSGTGTIQIIVNGATTDTGILTSSVFDGDTHRMSVSLNTGAGSDGRISLYIDGVEEFRDDGVTNTVGDSLTSGGIFVVGQDQDSLGGGFDPTQAALGSFGDIRVWSTERSEEDILATAFERFDNIDLMDHPSLVTNWQADETTGNFTDIKGGSTLNKGGTSTFNTSTYSHNGGDDSLDGGLFNDFISAGSGNDTLIGGSGTDTLLGRAGDDIFVISSSASPQVDIIDGGTGNDTLQIVTLGSFDFGGGVTPLSIEGIDFAGTGTSVVTLNAGQISATGISLTATIDGSETAGIEDEIRIDLDGITPNVDLGGWVVTDWVAGEDLITIRGNGNNNVATGSNAGDLLRGDAGNDTLNGGGGDDTLIGGANADELNGGAGVDTAQYTSAVIADLAVSGNNTGEAAGDTYISVENLTGSLLDDDLRGNNGANVLNGSWGNDTLSGAGGNDTLLGDLGADSLDGGDGADSIEGGDGNDTLIGGNGNDTLNGGVGDDIFVGQGGTDTFDGGDGTDTLNYTDNTQNVTLDVSAGTATFGGLTESFSNMEVYQTGVGDDSISGSGAGELILSGVGDDTVIDGSGVDTVDGGSGDDLIRVTFASTGEVFSGGLGTDTVDFTLDGGGGQVIDLSSATFSFFNAVFDGFEHVTDGAGSNTIIGSSSNNIIFAGSGNDTVDGGAGQDNLRGFSGDDNISGGLDGDTIRGDAGNDTLNGDDGDDLITGGAGNDVVAGGTGADSIFGQGGSDTIDGGTGNDTIFAGAGTDTVLGGDGDDEISGQGSADSIEGNLGADTLRGGSGDDTIDGGADDDLIFGNGNNDLVSGGSGNDTIQGADGLDTLTGGDGADVITGGNGNDSIDGGAGNDILNGGANADRFVFKTGSDTDRVNSYEQGIDVLELDSSLWAGNSSVVTGQDVVDIFGALNGTGSILTFDFGGSDILEVQNAGGINALTLGADVFIF